MNGVGTGACSSVTALSDSVPIRMNDPTVALSDINPTNIMLYWSAISADTDTGRDAVIYYHVDWD